MRVLAQGACSVQARPICSDQCGRDGLCPCVLRQLCDGCEFAESQSLHLFVHAVALMGHVNRNAKEARQGSGRLPPIVSLVSVTGPV